jgi:hypothetical protein
VIYFEYLHAAVWVPSRDEVPETIKQKIDIENCLISIIWSVNGIHSLLNVSKYIVDNSTFFYDSVVSDLVESTCAHNRRKTLKCIKVYFDDACPHNSKKFTEYLEQFRVRGVPHPDYRLNLAPNYFFSFGDMKSKLSCLAIRSRENLICEIRRIFEEIPKAIFIPVYASWIKWFKLVIKNDGDYFH